MIIKRKTFFDFSRSRTLHYSAWEERTTQNVPIDFKPVWKEAIYNNSRGDIIKMEDVWVGDVSTPPIEFRLFQP
ncbi:hypothetical protein WA1_46005 [Scytonema hofmannii PCC 7110]|uniref:Uncharacterized protein n=1 Tax=Scytonema hofmannii PCC 7110 TaxID=128403 RepID=A0A139WX68_9CYAN|nr:hypothetical protein [Scytonema hofmannii]KYC37003.1 hypothetical protein WA1_46005 [Scytonema hofmannii PCC 7110]